MKLSDAKSMRFLRGMLVFWTLFIGLGAVGGAVAMLADPLGEKTLMSGLLPGLRKLPFAETLFSDLTFSGIMLLIVNGVTQLFSFYMLAARRRLAPLCGFCCGIVLMLWITIQFFIFDFNIMSTAYYIFGILEALTGLLLMYGAKRK